MAKRIDASGLELEERLVSVNPVSKTVKGGRSRSFSALVVVGDGNGRVGAGLGKAKEVAEAIRKASDEAQRNLIEIPIVGTTIPHESYREVRWSPGHAEASLRRYRSYCRWSGRGLEVAGVKDILTKSLGSSNPINVVRATLMGIQKLRTVRKWPACVEKLLEILGWGRTLWQN